MKLKLISLFVVLFSVQGFAQTLKSNAESSFQEGEVLNYRLRYGFITAAEGTLKVHKTDSKFDNKPSYKLTVDGVTSGTFDIFYKIRDHYETYIDQDTFLPYYYQENIREASYRRQDKVRFYQSQKKVSSADKGEFTAPTNQTFDLVSAYYFARNLDLSHLKIGDKVALNYYLNGNLSSLSIEYFGKETIKTKLGNIRCLKFSPAIEPGRIFRKDSRLYLWVTDDGNRIPIKAQVEILVGAVTLEIKSVSGLKYPIAKN